MSMEHFSDLNKSMLKTYSEFKANHLDDYNKDLMFNESRVIFHWLTISYFENYQTERDELMIDFLENRITVSEVMTDLEYVIEAYKNCY